MAAPRGRDWYLHFHALFGPHNTILIFYVMSHLIPKFWCDSKLLILLCLPDLGGAAVLTMDHVQLVGRGSGCLCATVAAQPLPTKRSARISPGEDSWWEASKRVGGPRLPRYSCYEDSGAHPQKPNATLKSHKCPAFPPSFSSSLYTASSIIMSQLSHRYIRQPASDECNRGCGNYL